MWQTWLFIDLYRYIYTRTNETIYYRHTKIIIHAHIDLQFIWFFFIEKCWRCPCIIQETSRLEYLIPKKTSLRHRLPMGDQGFIDFVAHLLEVNPKKRPSALEALKHPWLSYPYEPISAWLFWGFAWLWLDAADAPMFSLVSCKGSERGGPHTFDWLPDSLSI